MRFCILVSVKIIDNIFPLWYSIYTSRRNTQVAEGAPLLRE